jgi:transcriptional regulator with XRE-family HTH domain
MFGFINQLVCADKTTMKKKDSASIEIGKRLAAVRRAKGVEPQKDMAAMIGAAQNQYSNWENGTGPIPVPFAIRFCDATGATLDYIYRDIRAGLPVSLAQKLPK